MDTENERDTHFKQFASLLWQELLLSENFSYNIVFTREEAKAIKMIIARRAYDLAVHVADEVRDPLYNDLDTLIQQQVADMMSFPKD